MSFRFDEATRVTATGEGKFSAAVLDRYNIGPVPNGGYVMSVVQRALSARLPGHQPLTLTTHFLRPATVAEATVEVEVLKEGRRYVTARARLWQGGNEVVSAIATMGAMGASGASGGGGLRYVAGEPPELPPLEEAVKVPGNDFFVIGREFDLRLHPRCTAWMRGQLSGEAVVEGYIRFADGREADLVSLPLFCDAAMPAIFGVKQPKHVPTIEMTVHTRQAPASAPGPGPGPALGWLRFRFQTRFAFDGHLEEDGELWDERGEQVALSRQLAVLT